MSRNPGDHPRMRGEHPVTSFVMASVMGSSPHARGARPSRGLSVVTWRIIPACAGSTRHNSGGSVRHGDHPRMRGEHITRPSVLRWSCGSSPHARGARGTERSRVITTGIIPACAGSTRRERRSPPRRRDHPRMRGEHLRSENEPTDHAGSSPHARGARFDASGKYRSHGIIPACAGSTPARFRRGTPWRDHPRMRGEHFWSASKRALQLGSSPHARGAPTPSRATSSDGGIIPACAGSTSFRTSTSAGTRDHPRMRGEHSS